MTIKDFIEIIHENNNMTFYIPDTDFDIYSYNDYEDNDNSLYEDELNYYYNDVYAY